jgi:hypothetical protein
MRFAISLQQILEGFANDAFSPGAGRLTKIRQFVEVMLDKKLAHFLVGPPQGRTRHTRIVGLGHPCEPIPDALPFASVMGNIQIPVEVSN